MDQQHNAASATHLPVDNPDPFESQQEEFNPATLVDEPYTPLATTRPFLGTPQQTPRDSSYSPPSPTNSSPLLPASDAAEKGLPARPQYGALVQPKNRRFLKKLFIIVPAVLAILALVITLPIVLTKRTSHAASSHSSEPAAGPSETAQPTARPTGAITGGDGSTVTKEDGSTFIYNNSFGGICESLFIISCVRPTGP